MVRDYQRMKVHGGPRTLGEHFEAMEGFLSNFLAEGQVFLFSDASCVTCVRMLDGMRSRMPSATRSSWLPGGNSGTGDSSSWTRGLIIRRAQGCFHLSLENRAVTELGMLWTWPLQEPWTWSLDLLFHACPICGLLGL